MSIERGSGKWSDDEERALEGLRRCGEGLLTPATRQPPRGHRWADRMRMAPGLVLDMTQDDPSDGRPWDFNDERKAEKAEEWIRRCNT
eukprot:1539156-Lingulodinium_polyedra.AAC.1